MERVFISLGSNLGDRMQNLAMACRKVGLHMGHIVQRSAVYQTSSWGYTDPHKYLNQVILLETQLSPSEVLASINEIECSMGRVRGSQRYAARTIDLDILFYGNHIVQSSELTIPHPLIQERKFILMPFNEIARDYVHPVLQKTIADLLKECSDNGEVELFQ